MTHGQDHRIAIRRSARPVASATLAAAVLAALAGTAIAQDNQRRLDRVLRTADTEYYRMQADTSLELGERTQFDAGGYFAMTALNVVDRDGNSRSMLQPEATIYGRASIDGVHTFFGRARFAYQAFSSGDSFDNNGDGWIEPMLDAFWYNFDLRRAMATYQGETIEGNLNISAGRQFVDWGSSIALSESLYAVRPTIEFDRQWKLDCIAGVTSEHAIDFDASRQNYDSRTQRGYFGANLSYTLPSSQKVYAYVLNMQDYYTGTVSREPIVLTDVPFDYTATYFAIGSTGGFDPGWLYIAEFIGELGQTTADPLRGNSKDNIAAFAGRLQATYVFNDSNLSQAQTEVLMASGDRDRSFSSTNTVGGNQPGTTDHGFNALGYANTGLAYAGPLSNLLSLRVGLSTHPVVEPGGQSDVQVGIDGFLFGKFDVNAPIDEPTVPGKGFIGGEFDLYANWRLTSDLSLSARYGIFLPGEAIAGQKGARQFIMLSAVLSF